MKNRIKAHLDNIFENAPDTPKNRDIKDEFYSNLCDKYDEYIGQGHEPEEAYKLTITTIGDIHSIMDNYTEKTEVPFEATEVNEKDVIPGVVVAESPDRKAKESGKSEQKKENRSDKEGCSEKRHSKKYLLNKDERREIRNYLRVKCLINAIAVTILLWSPAASAFYKIFLPFGWLDECIFLCMAIVSIGLFIFAGAYNPGNVKRLFKYRRAIDAGDLDEAEVKSMNRYDTLSAIMKAVAVVLYFAWLIPGICSSLFVNLPIDIWPISMFFCIGLATGIMVFFGGTKQKRVGRILEQGTDNIEFAEKNNVRKESNKSVVQKAIVGALWAVILIVYFFVSFITQMWWITWIIFLIGVALNSLVDGIFGLVRRER